MNGLRHRRRRPGRPRQHRDPRRARTRRGAAIRREPRHDGLDRRTRRSDMKIDGANILVTGGCGLIGSTTIDLLLRRARSGADRHPRQPRAAARSRNVEAALADPRVDAGARRHPRRRRTVHEVTEGMDAVIHMATLRITACAAEPREALGVMCDGSFNVLEAAQAAGVAEGRRRVVGVDLRPGRDVSRRARIIIRTTTAPGTAPARSCSKGCCARSTTCTACPTSRCATSTSTARAWTSTASTPRC